MYSSTRPENYAPSSILLTSLNTKQLLRCRLELKYVCCIHVYRMNSDRQLCNSYSVLGRVAGNSGQKYQTLNNWVHVLLLL